jgi:hypothetical protein
VWLHGFAHTVQASGGSDVAEEIWFLAQTPWAVVHAINPFANGWLNAPVGVNLMDNTSMPLLGVLGAPVTFLFGPIATFNVLMALAFSGSCMAFFLMARRFVQWWPAAFVGGLLYGLSPLAVGAAVGHLFVVFNVVPPLVVLVIHRFVESDYRSPWLNGAALGVCFVAQFYISTEVFASLAVMTAIGVVILGAWVVLRRIRVDQGAIVRMMGVAALVTLLGAGFGAWFALEGPEHITGPAQHPQAIAGLSSDAAGLVVPTGNQHFTFGHASLGDSFVAERDANWHITFDDLAENGTYVGVPLLILLVAGAIALRRKAIALFATLMAVIGMVLSMGSRLHIDGHLTPIRLPFVVLAHLPLLSSGVASRYVVYFWLFAALLFALVLDALYHAVRPKVRGGRAAIAIAVAVCALLPLLPPWPYTSTAAVVPSWFTTTAQSLPVGSTVVVYPDSTAIDSSGMLWQAMADMTFRMPGGYAVFAGPSRSASFFAADLNTPLGQAMNLCANGNQVPATLMPGIRAGLRQLSVRSVVVAPGTEGAPCAIALFDQLLGAHRAEGGVLLWMRPTRAN